MPAPSKPALVHATVARGRTVRVGKAVLGADGKVARIDETVHGPGSTVELPEEEVAHLRARGFLTTPNAPEIAPAVGPVFESQADRLSFGEQG